jgi:hypothetical protein
MKAPLCGHVGEPIEDSNCVSVTNVDQYVRAMQGKAWDKLIGTNALNHHSARIIDVYGMEWFQEHNNDNLEQIWEELEARRVERVLQKVWKRIGIPEDIDPYIDTIQWAYNFISATAYDYALGFGVDDSFHMKYVDRWLMNGHMPCGWSGKVPGEPRTRRGVSPYAQKPLQIATGTGKIKVF